MKTDTLITPIVKWVGGKRQLLPEIRNKLPNPKIYSTYCEPFLGGGAVFFDMKPQRAIVNDLNKELINLYLVIKNNVDELIEDLTKHEITSEYFYEIRKLDRDEDLFSQMSNIEKASRTLYLNKTCYNGLYRVNQKGQFNTPYGRYKNPNIVNEPQLRALSHYFNEADIRFLSKDYSDVLEMLDEDSFVYLDPPYDPVSETSSFTDYNSGGFGREEQKRLKQYCDYLHERGINFLLSNSATDFIKELYDNPDYTITTVSARRSINSVASKRGEVGEVLVRNYD